MDDREICIYLCIYLSSICSYRDLPGGPVVENMPASAGGARDVSSIPGSGRSPGVGNGNPLQYSCLGNPIERGVWWAAVQGVAKSWTRLSD